MTDERMTVDEYDRKKEQARILRALVDETARHNAELTRLSAELDKYTTEEVKK
jgi:hypothetical protein